MKCTTAIVLLLLVVLHLEAQHEHRVLDWKSEETVNTWLRQRMREQYDVRRKTFETGVSSKDAASVYRNMIRARYRKLIGTLPERTPLNTRNVGTIKQPGYTIEKVIFESIPGHPVTANLYVPDGKGPFPAVLLMCGHENGAKATESYQRTAILFALNKFVVLVVDPVSQSERHQLIDSSRKPITRGGTTEHTLINAAANLVGSGTVAYQLWENIRALDLLESRKEVDASRIGCLGNSGGGTQTTYLIAYDERIKVAAPCSYIASRERNFELFGANDGCQHVPGEGEIPLEHSDFLIAFAPKPLLILAGRYDFIDYAGSLKAHDELKSIYSAFGDQNKVRLFTYDDGHGISKPKREAAVSWFIQWLYNKKVDVVEPELKTLAEDELQCSDDGQAFGNFDAGVNAFAYFRERAKSMKPTAIAPDKLRETVVGLLGLHSNKMEVDAESRGSFSRDGVAFEKFIVRSQGDIPLPVFVARPSKKVNDVVIWFAHKGKVSALDSISVIRDLHSKGIAVIMADVSGVGELEDNASQNDKKYFNREYRNAMLAIHIGTSLPAMRARDMSRVVSFSEKVFPSVQSVNVHATGLCTIPALHAAMADRRIGKLSISGGIESYFEVFDKPDLRDWYSIIIPGMLRHYDLPELRSALGARLTNNE